MGNLRDKAMLVKFSSSCWTGQKQDRQASKSVEDKFETKGKAGKYLKDLAGEALDKIRKLQEQARLFHYKNSLPWEDGGVRLLPSAHYLEYASKMAKFQDLHSAEVQSFLSQYDSLLVEAEERLQGLYKASDFPDRQRIANKFFLGTNIWGVPAASDFRVTEGGIDSDSIRKDIENQITDKLAEAINDLWNRLSELISRVAETLSSKDKIFRDSLIDNLREFVALLPKLNITGDPSLTEIAERARIKLATLDPNNLREDATARLQAAGAAKKLLKDIANFLPVE